MAETQCSADFLPRADARLFWRDCARRGRRDVPAARGAAEGGEGAYVLAPGALGAPRRPGRPGDRGAPRGTGCAGPREGAGLGAADHGARRAARAVLAPGAAIAVRLNEIRLERPRAFGAVWLRWTLWRALGLDTLCAELLPPGREAVPWATMAAVLVLGRPGEPSTDRLIAWDWYR